MCIIGPWHWSSSWPLSHKAFVLINGIRVLEAWIVLDLVKKCSLYIHFPWKCTKIGQEEKKKEREKEAAFGRGRKEGFFHESALWLSVLLEALSLQSPSGRPREKSEDSRLEKESEPPCQHWEMMVLALLAF